MRIRLVTSLLDVDGQAAAGWTAIFLQKWEPVFPGEDLLIACLDQHYSKFETCWYMGAGAIERYDNQLKIKIRQTDTGLEIGDEHFNGDHPKCPLSRSPGAPHDKYYEEIKVKDIEDWLNQFTP